MLLSSSNRKYPPFPLLSYFSVVVCLGCLLHQILPLFAYTFRENREWLCFHYYFTVYDECKYSDTFWLADRTRLFVEYNISLSSLCKLICGYWTQIYFVECVSKINHILSVIHYTICGAVCFQFTHSLVMIERIYILCLIIIIKSEVWTMTHCLGLGHETMVSAVCPSIFLKNGSKPMLAKWAHVILALLRHVLKYVEVTI